MNIDRSPGDFRRAEPAVSHQGLVGRSWSGVKRWSSDNPRLSRVVWFAVGLSLLALLIWAIYPSSNNARRGMINQAAQPVGVARAVSGDINVTLNALGTVTPLATATVRPQVGGMLIKINFTEGQMVKAGDTLAQIDPRPYQAALDQVRGQLARDAATLANAKVDLARYKALQAQNAIAAQQVSSQEALVKSTEGIVISDQANVETARINLGYTSIVSPVGGRAGIHLVDIGNIVSASQSAGIVTVTQLTPMSVLFTIPEDSLPAVRKRIKAGAVLDATALDRAQKETLGKGKLSTTDNQVDTTTGTVKLRALFDNADESMFPNQFVNIKLLVDTVKDATVVPVAAVQRGQPGIYVYQVKADDTVHIQVVETGATDGEKIAITKGLAVGDQVVIDGVDRLREGAKIRKPVQGGAKQDAKPAGDNTEASAAPNISDTTTGSTAPQTGEAPAPVPAQGQQHRGPGERRANGGAGRPAQTNQ